MMKRRIPEDMSKELMLRIFDGLIFCKGDIISITNSDGFVDWKVKLTEV